MEIKKSQAEKCINSMNAEFVVYSDGPASSGTKNGGAGVAITRGVAENPTVIKELRVKGAQLTCSYEEEPRAGTAAIEWLNEQGIPRGAKVVIATYSQSLCKALSGNGTEIAELV